MIDLVYYYCDEYCRENCVADYSDEELEQAAEEVIEKLKNFADDKEDNVASDSAHGYHDLALSQLKYDREKQSE